MQNKTIKIIFFITIVLLLIIVPTLVNASGGTIDGADSFINAASGSPIKQSGLVEASNTLYNTLLFVGITIAMIVITALGIKFMMGSTEEKAKVKETLIPFTVGCIILFGGFTIWQIVMQLIKTLK